MSKISIVITFLLLRAANAGISIAPGISPDDVVFSTISIDGESYTAVSINGLLSERVSDELGLPGIPAAYKRFILPPGQEISSITMSNEIWQTLSIDHAIAPIQDLSDPDAEPVAPVGTFYNSVSSFPESVVSIAGQSSLSGFGVATICVAPVRYFPAEGRVEVLTSADVNIEYSYSQFDAAVPLRSSAFAAGRRLASVEGSVLNSEDIGLYPSAPISVHEGCTPLYITEEPSIYGDAVDFVIITVDEYVSDFEEIAERRTEQGLITVIRTVDWINETYTGCDTPQRIRNFIKDAHSKWGIEFVLLGGEEEDVPDRLVTISGTTIGRHDVPYETYYGELNRNWVHQVGQGWKIPYQGDHLIEVSVARLPINSGSDDFDNFISKLIEYENPTSSRPYDDTDYLKRICSFTDFTSEGWYDHTDFELGEYFETSSDWMSTNGGPVTDYINLYNPISFFYGDRLVYYEADALLNRSNALSELNESYNIFLHTDHSGIHNLGMGTGIFGPNKLFDADFYNMNNDGHPFIFYSSCCWPGHYNGAESILEHSLFASDESGAVASVGAPVSNGDFSGVYYFLDAFYPFLHDYSEQLFSEHDPYFFIGEGWKHKMNVMNRAHFEILFGDPTMFVWRDMPDELVISGLPTSPTAGALFSPTIHVTDGTSVIEGATVVLWMDGELYATEVTDASGDADFTDLYSATPGTVKVTAHKFRDSSDDISNYIIERTSFSVGANTDPILSIESFDIDDSGLSTEDDFLNPGETVYIDLVARNTGGDETSNVTATLTALTSTYPGVTILDNSASITRISEGTSATVNNAFQIELSENFDTSKPIGFTVSFSSVDGNWSSLVYAYAASGDIHIPVSDLTIDDFSWGSIGISIERMVLYNSGVGDVAGLTVTARNFVPSHSSFSGTRSAYFSSIEAQSGAEADGVIDFSLTNLPVGSYWLEDDMPGCSFDLVITDAAGNNYTTKAMNMQQWAYAINTCPNMDRAPYNFLVNEATSSTADIVWSQYPLEGATTLHKELRPRGYCVYMKNTSNDWELVSYYLSPAPEWNFTDLEAMTEYEICATVVDSLGRESIMSYPFEFSTTCPQETGWPRQLYGNIGSGPLVANVDGAAGDEIVAVTDCGNLYVGNSSSDFAYPVLSESSIWFTGCATADINDDGNVDIVAAGMNDITNGEVNICLIERDAYGDWDITTTYWTNDDWKMHENTGVPMIFQADATDELEIAFRTYNGWFGGNKTELQVLKHNPTTGYIENYFSIDPPVIGDGNNTLVYTPPVLLEDYDSDGNVELALTCHTVSGQNYNIPAIAIVDIASVPVVECFNIPLPTDPDLTDDEVWKIRSTLAAVTYNTKTYVTGILSYHYDGSSLDDRKLFIFNVTDETFVSVDGGIIEDVIMFDCSDHFTGGPCIGYVDTNSKPDILVVMDGLYAWDLDGSVISMGSSVPELVEDRDIFCGGSLSAPSLASIDGGANVAFTGYSSRTYGHSMSDGSILTGFPHYTEDQVYTTPIVFDFDGDGNIEVLNGNKSGLLSMLDWDENLGTGLTWPMFQHDPQRTGYWNHVARGNGLDICVSSVLSLETASISGSNAGSMVEVTIEVTGAEAVSPEITHAEISSGSGSTESSVVLDQRNSLCSSSSLINDDISVSEISVPAISLPTASVAIVDSNSRILTIKEFPLVNGTQRVRISVPAGVRSFSAIADPFNEYAERSESNNAGEATVLVGSSSGISIGSFGNPARNAINLDVLIGDDVSGDLSVTAYSLAGRVVSCRALTDVAPGSHHFELRGEAGAPLPSGAYIVRIEGSNFDESRSVILLNN